MASIIEEFYYGNIEPQELNSELTPKLKKKLNNLAEKEEQLTAKLNGEDKELFQSYVSAYAKSVLEDDEYIENLISSIISESKKDNTLLPMLKRELSEVDKRIRNMLNAIQDGIYTSSTKQRLEELEARKEDIEVQLAMEELGRTKINEYMLYMWFNKMKSLDITSLDYKRMFFDAFVNSVYVMDNGIEIALNYKEGTKIITFDEMKKFYNEGSDLSPPARPNKDFNHRIEVFIFFEIKSQMQLIFNPLT